VVMVEDCCAALSDDEHRAALENIIQQFGDVMTAEEVVARLRHASNVPPPVAAKGQGTGGHEDRRALRHVGRPIWKIPRHARADKSDRSRICCRRRAENAVGACLKSPFTGRIRSRPPSLCWRATKVAGALPAGRRWSRCSMPVCWRYQP